MANNKVFMFLLSVFCTMHYSDQPMRDVRYSNWYGWRINE